MLKICGFLKSSRSGGIAENEKVTDCTIFCFQFQLCHQRALFKYLHIFSIYGHLVKKVSYRFLKDGLVVK